MKLNIDIPKTAFCDPSTNLVVVAFTNRYDDHGEPVSVDQARNELVAELQAASDEGLLSGDFQVAEHG